MTGLARNFAAGPLGVLLLAVWSAAGATAADPTSDSRSPVKASDAPAQEPHKPAAEPATPAQPDLSDAERIARLQRAIAEKETSQKTLEAELNNPKSEYQLAQEEFQAIDTQVSELTRNIQKLKDQDKADEAAVLSKELEALQKPRKLAKERFELAIDDRKARLNKIATIKDEIVQDKAALDRLINPPLTKPKPPASPPAVAAPPPAASAAAPPAATAAPAPMPAVTNPLAGAAGTAQTAPAAPAAVPGVLPVPASPELEEARREAQKKEQAAQSAAIDAQSVEKRLNVLEREIEIERQLRATAQKKAENANETERMLAQDLQHQIVQGASQAAQDDLWQKINEAKRRNTAALAELRRHTERIDELRSQLFNEQAEQLQTLERARRIVAAAAAAREQVEKLENPFTVQNILIDLRTLLKWLVLHGPRVLLIVIGVFVLLRFARLSSRRAFRIMTGGKKTPDDETWANRAKTLAVVFENAARVAITIGGTLLAFSEVGVDVAVLLGGVAVLGLAVAFGAQNLIRDYFNGFMILLENQYTLNDVVKIGDISGQVERVTLRMTVLRDEKGNVHFLPNGQINAVTNMTHGWSRAVFEIGVAYKEKVDQVMKVLLEIAEGLQKDSYFGWMILESPTMLGVDSLGESSVVIKFLIKTRPLQQWNVTREMLRRIKNRFDELNIEIPFPCRTVYHRQDGPPVENGDIAVPPIKAEAFANRN